VKDHHGQKLAYVYFEDEPGRQAAANQLTHGKMPHEAAHGRSPAQVSAEQCEHLAPAALGRGMVVDREVRHHPAMRGAEVDFGAVVHTGFGQRLLKSLGHRRRAATALGAV
jgi:hypothetical protein